MLQPEITPFGEAHIKNLKSVQTELEELSTNPNITADQAAMMGVWIRQLGDSVRGFTRFMVCAEDEWKQKERYAKYAKEHGYPYS